MCQLLIIGPNEQRTLWKKITKKGGIKNGSSCNETIT